MTDMISFAVCGPKRAQVRLRLSKNLVQQLCVLAHDRLDRHNFHALRLQIGRYPQHAPHLVLLQIAPLSFNPVAHKLRQRARGHAFEVNVAARELEIRGDAVGAQLEHYLDKEREGIMIMFPEEALTDEALARWHRLQKKRAKMTTAAAG